MTPQKGVPISPTILLAVFLHCGKNLNVSANGKIDVSESLHGVTLASEFGVDPVKTLSLFLRALSMSCLELLCGHVLALSFLSNSAPV